MQQTNVREYLNLDINNISPSCSQNIKVEKSYNDVENGRIKNFNSQQLKDREDELFSFDFEGDEEHQEVTQEGKA